jgi:hypothetical protein
MIDIVLGVTVGLLFIAFAWAWNFKGFHPLFRWLPTGLFLLSLVIYVDVLIYFSSFERQVNNQVQQYEEVSLIVEAYENERWMSPTQWQVYRRLVERKKLLFEANNDLEPFVKAVRSSHLRGFFHGETWEAWKARVRKEAGQ